MAVALTDMVDDEFALTLFVSQAEIAAEHALPANIGRLDHPNIVTIHDAELGGSQADFRKMPAVSAKLYKNIAALLSSRLRHSNELLSIDMRRA